MPYDGLARRATRIARSTRMGKAGAMRTTRRMYEKILVPADGSPCSERATSEVVRLAMPFARRLLYVLDTTVTRDGSCSRARSSGQ